MPGESRLAADERAGLRTALRGQEESDACSHECPYEQPGPDQADMLPIDRAPVR